MKTIGILGGLGPQTTSEFFLDVIKRATKIQRPALCIWSLPLNIKKEAEHIATGKHADHFLTLLIQGTQVLNRAGVDEIVIPCNTVHEFHSQLLARSHVQIANIIDLTAQEVGNRNWRSALLLATSQTIRQELFQKALARSGVDLRIPSTHDQQQLDALIQGLLTPPLLSNPQEFLQRVIRRSQTQNIILGCTDLQLVLQPNEHVIDSMQELAKHTAIIANQD